MNEPSKKHNQWESGQALIEYYVLIPLSIPLFLLGFALSGFIGNAFHETLVGLQCDFGTVNGQADEDDNQNGNTFAQIFDHTIVLAGQVYDSVNGTTTITYIVTSGRQPSISHWTLSIPQDVASRVIRYSEQAAWINSDPTTGAVGVKFDTGYNDLQSRTIIMTLRGEFEFGNVTATTKSGRNQVGMGQISAPMRLRQDDTEPEQTSEGCAL